jgi:hypothetical protein
LRPLGALMITRSVRFIEGPLTGFLREHVKAKSTEAGYTVSRAPCRRLSQKKAIT